MNQEIKFVKKEFEIDIENARKKAWDGWEWTPFPIVWDRFTYNLFEPEIRKAEKKSNGLIGYCLTFQKQKMIFGD